MKKSFYFALALTAGLFASCSSDDLTADAPQQSVKIDDSAPALIKFNIGNPNGTTRGTGSVGWEGNKWEGQSFNIFMFEKGTLDLAYEATDEAGDPIYIFNNTELVTSDNAQVENQADANYYIIPEEGADPEIQFNYFPSNGKSYSFWAYRIDDADDGAYKFTNDNGEEVEQEAATQVRVPFDIDGSQDIMIAETQEGSAATDLIAADAQLGKTLSQEDAEAKIYSAYSARRDVNPKLNFSHKLTRLYFYVKAASKDVSDKAVNQTDMLEDANGTVYYPGYKVTGVSVMSKSKGEVIAAYKEGIPEEAERVVWTDATQQWSDPTSLAELQLRSRETAEEDPDFIWYPIATGATVNVDLDDEGITEGYYYLGGRIIPFSNAEARSNFVVYKSNRKNEKGEPDTEPIKWSDIGEEETVYLALVPEGTHTNGEPWTKFVETSYAKENLLDELTAVTPKWYTPANESKWDEYEGKATSYTWTERANPTDGQKEAAETVGASVTINENYSGPDGVALVIKDGDADGTFLKQTKGGSTKYYELTAIAYDTDDVEEVDEFPANAQDGDIVKLDDKYYKYTAVNNAGEGELTPVGEAVLVAPEDEGYGYTVNFTFSRCKKLTAHSWVEQPGESTITVKLKQAAGFNPATAEAGTANAFQPGKAYKVTAVIYSDGEIKTENVTIINWDSDTEDEMDNGGIVDMN